MKRRSHKISKIFALSLGLTALSAAAQYTELNDDFEGNGTIPAWVQDDCILNTAFPNPYIDAENPSATVMRYQDNGGNYANVRFSNAVNFNWSTGTEFSLKVYVPSNTVSGNSPNQVSLKLQNAYIGAPWETQSEIILPIVLDQWQTLTFDFNSGQHLNFDQGSAHPRDRVDFNRLLLQVNGENNNNPVVAFFDDFSYDGFIGYDPDDSESVFNELVWSDEFNINGGVDASKWHHQTQLPYSWGWFNGEQQHYTDELTNSFVQGGYLHIVAKRENYFDQGLQRQFTSARLNSKFAFTYGRVEARAKLPFGGGTWPAIWMLGKNVSEAGGYWYSAYGNTGWPACGEIDIMEHWGWNQNYVSSALHTPSSSGATENHGGLYAPDVSNEYHIYGVEWDEEEIRFTMDGQVHYTYHPNFQNADTWPFFQDQYLILNIAIQEGISSNFQESEMEIDYVRVYQESTIAVNENTESIKSSIKAIAQGENILIQNNSEHLLHLSIYDVQGRLLHTSSNLNPGQSTLSLPNATGVLMLQYELNGQVWGARLLK